MEEFPQLTLEELRSLTLGQYQLRQARSYFAEHVKNSGAYWVQVYRHQGPISRSTGLTAIDPMLMRGRIQSRHHNSTKYWIYISIDRSKCGVEAVSAHSCSCPNGRRTVGCCAHITTVLWYLGYARYLSEIPIPAAFLDNVCVELEGQE